MRLRILERLAFCAAVAVALTGCDDGASTGGFSDIGSTGITTTGRITGFGSVFVNGIEYDTSGATVTVNEQAAGAQALRLGMVVTVTGEQTGSNNGTATTVVYDAEVRGPVTAANTLDAETRLLTVAGTDIMIDANTTAFRDTGFSSVGVDLMVEASGYVDASGRLHATYLEGNGPFEAGNNGIEVSGTVSNHVSPRFELNGLTVLYQPFSTALPTEGISNGDRVEVEGTASTSDPGQITATGIELEDIRLPADGGNVELEGIVTEFNGLADFRLSGRPVDAGGGTVQFRPAALATDLGSGSLVAVKGSVSGGALVASSVEAAGGDIEIEGFVSTVDATTFNLVLTPSGTLTVSADNRTSFNDETGAATTTFALAEIAAGDFLEIEAHQSSAGDIIASHIKRVAAAGRIELQGPVDAFDATAGTLDILGVTFGTNKLTDFTVGDTPATADGFFDNLEQGTVVRVEETLVGTTIGDGTAEEMEIEG